MGERSLSKKSKGQDPFSSLPAHGDQGLGSRFVTGCTSSACVSWNLHGEESFPCTELSKGPGARSLLGLVSFGSPSFGSPTAR